MEGRQGDRLLARGCLVAWPGKQVVATAGKYIGGQYVSHQLGAPLRERVPGVRLAQPGS